MLVLRKFCFAATVLLLCSTAVAQPSVRLSDDELMTVVQKSTFEYFWDGAEKNSKWARERIHIDEPGIDETLVFFRHDYLDELMGNRGLVGTFWIKAANAEVIPGLI